MQIRICVHLTYLLLACACYAQDQCAGETQSIDAVASCSADRCNDAPTHPCSNASSLIQRAFTYYFSAPEEGALYMPADGSGLVTYGSCRACYAQCRYDLAAGNGTACSCGQLAGTGTWVRDQTWLQKSAAQQRTVLAKVLNATTDAPARAPDPAAANTGLAQGRRIYRALTVGADASTLDDCARKCNDDGACKAWQWDAKQALCAHAPKFDPSADISDQYGVQTCMRWRGLDTTIGDAGAMSPQPYAYGRTAPYEKSVTRDRGYEWLSTLSIFKIEVRQWCGEHAMCHELACNCTLRVTPSPNTAAVMLAIDARLNLGWSAFVEFLGVSVLSNKAYNLTGYGMGNVYALYQKEDNQDFVTARNPYAPNSMPMPDGVVPGAPWPNAEPLTSACPTITHWSTAMQFDADEVDLHLIYATPAGNDDALLPRWRPPGNGDAFCAQSNGSLGEGTIRVNSCDLPPLPASSSYITDVRCSNHVPPPAGQAFWSTLAGKCQAITSANASGARCMIASSSGDTQVQGTAAADALDSAQRAQPVVP